MINKIKRLMNFEGINQAQFAKKINLSPVSVSRYLSGKRKITINFAVSVSKAFNVSLDWLLKD